MDRKDALDLEAGAVPTTGEESKTQEKEGEAPPTTGPGPEVDDGKPEGSRMAITFSCLVLAMFLAALDQTIVSTALPTIASQLDASSSEYSWVGTSYLLMTTTLTPCYGRLSDLLGRKILLQVSIVLFIVASALCGAAQNIRWLIACRAFQGIGGGGIMSMTSILVGDIVPYSQRGKYQGYLGGVWGVASVLGPILGGLLTDKASWRWCFFINLPTCAVAFAVLWFSLKLPPHNRGSWQDFQRKFDWIGLGLLSSGLACIVVGFEQATDHSFKSPAVIALLVVGAVVLCLAVAHFVTTKKRGIIPARIFRTRTTGGLMLMSYLQAFCFLSSAFYLPMWWQGVKGVTATMSGVHLLPFSLMVSVVSLPTGWFISNKGFVRTVIRLGYAIALLGFGIMHLMSATSSLAINEVCPMIAAIGIGMSLQPPLILLQAAMPLGDMAASASSFMLVRSLGATTGISIAGSVLATRQQALLAGVQGYTFVGVPSTRAEYDAMQNLQPESLRLQVLGAFADSFQTFFTIFACFLGACLILTLTIKHYSLQEVYVPKNERGSATTLPVPTVFPAPLTTAQDKEKGAVASTGNESPRSTTTFAEDVVEDKKPY